MQRTKVTEGLVLKELWLTWEFLVQKQTPNKVTFDHNLKFWIGNSTGRNIQPIIFKCVTQQCKCNGDPGPAESKQA